MRSLLMTILIAGLVAGCSEDKDAKSGDDGGVDIKKGIDDVKKGADDVKKDVEKDVEKGMDDAKDAAGDMVEKAKTMLADAMSAIKDGGTDKAKGLLEKLDGMKGSLPDDLQKQIADAWTALKAKDKLGGMLPK